MTSLIFASPDTWTSPEIRVLDLDPAGLSRRDTDFLFDFSSDDCFFGGRPADGVAVTSGVHSATINTAGSGGVNGTYALAFAGGGGGSGAAGTATVSGGAYTAVAITNPGSGYAATPTVTVPGSGVIGGSILVNNLAGIKNLALNANTLLGRTGEVYGKLIDNTLRPIRNGNGLRFLSGSYSGIYLSKDGVAANRVLEPSLEGFIDNLLLVTIRPDGFASLASPFVAGTGSGSTQYGGFLGGGTAGQYLAYPGAKSTAVLNGASAGTLTQIGLLTRYDTGAGTTSIYPIRDGVVSGTALAGTAPASIASNAANAFTRIGGGGTSGPGVFNGTIYRLRRDLVELGGVSDANIAKRVLRDWQYAQDTF